MQVKERVEGDRERLAERIAEEKRGTQRDRLRAVALALDGWFKLDIAAALRRSKSFVETWVYAYREGGLDAIRAIPQEGRTPILSKEREAEFLARVDAGPRPEDGVCTLRGSDLRRILQDEFKAKYSERGVYALMKRVGYASLTPRPIHEKHDPKRAEAYQQSAPLLSKPKRRSVRGRGSA